MNKVHFTRGANGKPVATQALEYALSKIEGLSGECFFGYPLIAAPEGKYSIDATLVSPEKGVVLFDLVEGNDLADYASRQDDLANRIEAKLRLHKELLKGRRLLPPLRVVTFAPAVTNPKQHPRDDYPIANEATLADLLNGLSWDDSNEDLYGLTLSAIESLSSIRKSRSKRDLLPGAQNT